MEFAISTTRALLGLVLLFIAITLYLVHVNKLSKRLPLPPGPPGHPLWGHLQVIPKDHPEHQFVKWGKQYNSDVLYFNVLGRKILVVNSVDAAHNLMDKKGANYSDRPRFVLFEVMGWGVTLTFLRWSPRFKLHRKLLQQSFTQTACKPYRPIQQEEARRAVKAILCKPQDWELLLRQFSTAVVLRIGFGIDVKEENDPYVQMAINVEEATGKGGVPGASIVDFFPIFRYLPNISERFSTIFQPLVHARRSKPTIQQLHDAPWDAMESLIRSGTATQPSFMLNHFGRYLSNQKLGKVNEATIADLKGAAGAISIAGGNTTWSTVIVCVLNLMMHPEIQAKVQDEIDRVVGLDNNKDLLRLPNFEDRAHLKYLENVIQEATRWAPLSPLGVPHASLADDTYNGYFIPAGSVVFANAWAMSRDERFYSSPDDFNPDRYIPCTEVESGKGEPLPEGPFGFGRRVCPGQHLALAGVYIVVATLLATMDLRCPVDETSGERIEPRVTFSNGLSGVPDSFPCVITPRSERAKELLLTS
ncbi:cytochrome P450 [Penicillium verhagenii]|uniref:cytochrome P450 n=1 Tax=Penicillium verhagenii TaxID=1562060 RepID=UPI002544D9F4|nr:cytochrome P450 [Penicillium verhagenii]KAJ5930183.1 cytochrome P450 [Penicillium verhagenii]